MQELIIDFLKQIGEENAGKIVNFINLNPDMPLSSDKLLRLLHSPSDLLE